MKVYLDSIGCRLNQSEIETYARQFRAVGHTLVASPEEADLVVINTCTVTSAADADSRSKIRMARRAGAQQVVVTGCWSTLNPQSAASLPGVTHVIPNAEKDRLVSNLLQIPPESFELEPIERKLIPGARARTRAFIKVQDGCDNRCTFCITTLARGGGRSRTVEQVVSDVRRIMWDPDKNPTGAHEIVLTGVHLGSWGYDFNPPLSLRHLVQSLLDHTDVSRIRLSSLEPWDLDEEFFTLWQNHRLCRHLHLPLQSGCAKILRRMARKTTPDSFRSLVNSARALIPGIAVTTDVIVGFPGEDEADFADSMAFVQEIGFAGGHVFTYSKRPGTAAARMPDQVPQPISKERNARMRGLFAESAFMYRSLFLGKKLQVLWESVDSLGPESWHMSGLTDNYLRVDAQLPQPHWNQITPVHLTGLTEDGLIGVEG